VRFAFKDAKLERLYTQGTDASSLPLGVYEAFVDAVTNIALAENERELYALKSNHMERLRGDRKGQYSIRLNKRFRLCFEIIKDKLGNLIWILELVDYH
jgi:toxin HigB-1